MKYLNKILYFYRKFKGKLEYPSKRSVSKAINKRNLIQVSKINCKGHSQNYIGEKFYDILNSSYFFEHFPMKKSYNIPFVRDVEVQHFSDGSTEVLCPYANYYTYNPRKNYVLDDTSLFHKKGHARKVFCDYHKQLLFREINNLASDRKHETLQEIFGNFESVSCPRFRDVLKPWREDVIERSWK